MPTSYISIIITLDNYNAKSFDIGALGGPIGTREYRPFQGIQKLPKNHGIQCPRYTKGTERSIVWYCTFMCKNSFIIIIIIEEELWVIFIICLFNVNYGRTFEYIIKEELRVNFWIYYKRWIMGQLLTYGFILELLGNFLIMGDLLNYGWTFDGFTTNMREEKQEQDKLGF